LPHKRFSGKFWEIRAKHPSHPQKLLGHTPVLHTIFYYWFIYVLQRQGTGLNLKKPRVLSGRTGDECK